MWWILVRWCIIRRWMLCVEQVGEMKRVRVLVLVPVVRSSQRSFCLEGAFCRFPLGSCLQDRTESVLDQLCGIDGGCREMEDGDNAVKVLD